MALVRRSGSRFSANIWPGFVDAMTAILLVLMFVLSIFMIVQSMLRDRITYQNSELVFLNSELSRVKNELGLEKSKLAQLDAQYEQKLYELVQVEERLKIQTANYKELDLRYSKKNSLLQTANSDMDRLNSQLLLLANELGNEQLKFLELNEKYQEKELQLEMTSTVSKERLELLSALRSSFDLAQEKIVDFEQQVASLLSKRYEMVQELEKTKIQVESQKSEINKNLSQLEIAKTALFNAREEINKNVETARLAAARSEALEVLIQNLRDGKSKLEISFDSLEKEINRKKSQLTQIQGKLQQNLFSLQKVEERLQESERNRVLEQAAIASLKKKLLSEKEELSILTLALDSEKKKAMKTLELLASARAIQSALEEKNQLLKREIGSTEELLQARQVALKEARAQLLQEKEAGRASVLEIARLTDISASLDSKLRVLQSVLNESERKDSENKVQLELLGSRLNAALAQVASEQRKRAELERKEVERLLSEAKDLKNYRSEFFGRLRQILGNKEGVEIVGDRFVFSSEVLFNPGSAVLGDEGKKQLSKVASVVREVSGDIPREINWIMRVDGHTDVNKLVAGSRFADNWELSQARALSVVKYLIKRENIPPTRLAAAGFGEYQPIESGLYPEAFARNRRIEIKLTEK